MDPELIVTLTGVALYVLVSVINYVLYKAEAIDAWIVTKPKLYNVVRLLEAAGFDWKKSARLARERLELKRLATALKDESKLP